MSENKDRKKESRWSRIKNLKNWNYWKCKWLSDPLYIKVMLQWTNLKSGRNYTIPTVFVKSFWIFWKKYSNISVNFFMDEAGVKINCFGSATRHLGKAIFTWKERQKIRNIWIQNKKKKIPYQMWQKPTMNWKPWVTTKTKEDIIQ